MRTIPRHLKSLVMAMLLLLTTACASTSSRWSKGGSDPLAARDYALSQRIVFNAARAAMVEMGWAVDSADPEVGLLRGHTNMTMASWREDVVINIIPVAGDKVRVNIRSQAYQLIDWGKNAENIQRFYESLEQNLKELPPPTPPPSHEA